MPLVGTATLAERPRPTYLPSSSPAGSSTISATNCPTGFSLVCSTPSWKKRLPKPRKLLSWPRRAPIVRKSAWRPLRPRSTPPRRLAICSWTPTRRRFSRAGCRRRPGCPRTLGVRSRKLPRKPWPRSTGPGCFNMVQVRVPWREIAPSEGQYRWEGLDSMLSWGRKAGLAIEVGPLVEFRYGRPTRLAVALGGRQRNPLGAGGRIHPADRTALPGPGAAVAPGSPAGERRYPWPDRGRANPDHLAGHSSRSPGRPWCAARDRRRPALGRLDGVEPLSTGPAARLRLLAGADLGLSAIAIEVAPGFSPPGSHIRDLFEFSKLLDLYSLLNVPLCIWMALLSAAGPDPLADKTVQVEAQQWPASLDENLQAAWGAKWLALAVAKPFVRTACWQQSSDAVPHLYPHAGLLDRTRPPSRCCRGCGCCGKRRWRDGERGGGGC